MKLLKAILFIFTILALYSCKDSKNPPIVEEESTVAYLSKLPTPDELYPKLFKTVQLNSVFPDSKTFVDCTAKASPSEINRAFDKLPAEDAVKLKAFVESFFQIPGSISSDFKSDPNRSASEHVAVLWPVLSRKADEEKAGSTLIPLPKPYLVPGGRFREVYYWDSYFTLLGLVDAGQFEMIENILDNFAYLINTVGHIPNGNRVYYQTRSQPPFFSQMIKLLADVKGKEVYEKYYPALKKEYKFWMNKAGESEAFEHTVEIGEGVLNRYYDKGETARQESYKEDFELVEENKGSEKMYRDLRSGAESGWDYSSRWFADGQSMSTIETTDIIPVDLTALMYGMESVLLETATDPTFRKQLKASQAQRKQFLSDFSFMADGSFEDYNWVKQKTTGIKSLAMAYPLFFKMATQEQADAVALYIKQHFLKTGGVVTTLVNTGQQWDAPNGWAPLQWLTVIGLDHYGYKELAREIATSWVALNEKVYRNTGKFVEKYNVEDMSLEAGGGEYPVQDGFGWSNGVYLALKNYLQSSL